MNLPQKYRPTTLADVLGQDEAIRALRLYAGDPSQFISQVLGAPVKRVSPAAAARLAKAEQPKTKKKKAAAGFYG